MHARRRCPTTRSARACRRSRPARLRPSPPRSVDGAAPGANADCERPAPPGGVDLDQRSSNMGPAARHRRHGEQPHLVRCQPQRLKVAVAGFSTCVLITARTVRNDGIGRLRATRHRVRHHAVARRSRTSCRPSASQIHPMPPRTHRRRSPRSRRRRSTPEDLSGV